MYHQSHVSCYRGVTRVTRSKLVPRLLPVIMCVSVATYGEAKLARASTKKGRAIWTRHTMDGSDKYEQYNYDDSVNNPGRKGKGKSGPAKHSQGAGHGERKAAENIQHGEDKRKEANLKHQKDK